MADEDIATKAPESDAVQESLFRGDSVAQQGPSMGEHCVTDKPAPPGHNPSGELTKLGDSDVYVTKPADYPHAPSKLLLLLTGGTGVRSTNNQLQADKFAAEGFLVVMPDQFGGDAAPNSVPESADTESLPLIERIKLGITDTAKSFMIDMWLARHTPEKVLPRLLAVIDAAKSEFGDAAANGGGIYAVGYCFGAKYALLLASEHPTGAIQTGQTPEDEEEGQIVKGPLIKVGAVAHGTQVTPAELTAVKVPMLIIGVKNDPLFPEEVLQTGVEGLEKSGVKHEVKVYPGVPHGFAVFGDYPDQHIKEAQQQAFGQMLAWLKDE